jgi:hypothetical protein
MRDPALIDEFEAVQRVVGLGRAARNDTRLRVRQPLARLLVRVPDEAAAAAVRPSSRSRSWRSSTSRRSSSSPQDADLVELPHQAQPAAARQALRQARAGHPRGARGRRWRAPSRPRPRAAAPSSSMPWRRAAHPGARGRARGDRIGRGLCVRGGRRLPGRARHPARRRAAARGPRPRAGAHRAGGPQAGRARGVGSDHPAGRAAARRSRPPSARTATT